MASGGRTRPPALEGTAMTEPPGDLATAPSRDDGPDPSASQAVSEPPVMRPRLLVFFDYA